MTAPPASFRSLGVESRAVYLALLAGGVGAAVGPVVVALNAHLKLTGPGSFGLIAAAGSALVAAAVAGLGYVRSRTSPGQEWRRSLSRASTVVSVAAVVIAHTAIAFLGTYAAFLMLSRAVKGLRVDGFFGATLMGLVFAATTYMVFRSVARTTTQRMTSLLMAFVVLGCLTSAVTTSDPLWWKVHFSQLGTYGDVSSWIFNGTLIAGGLLVATFAVYLSNDMSRLVATGALENAVAPRTVSRLFVIMGVMLAVVGLVPVDISFLIHSVAASGMAVVFIILLVRGRRLLAGMPPTYFLAAWVFLGAIAVSVALFLSRYFSVTAFEIVAFGLIFGWITVFIRFLGATEGRPDAVVPVLIALTGLPGSGKTTVARELAARLGAVHVRVDVVETALETSGSVSLAENPALGYRVAYFLAGDHLRSGVSVVADTVNPIAITRDAWRGVAAENGARIVEVEVVCSDPEEHRRRVEARVPDIPGHVEPSWEDVNTREFEPLGPGALRVDTATDIEGAVNDICVRIRAAADT